MNEKGFRLQERKGIKYFLIPAFEKIDLVTCAFSTRVSGASEGPFRSLNLGLHVTDRDEDVLENRLRFSKVLDIAPEDLVCARQIHKNRIAIVTEKNKGRGATDYFSAIPETDGFLTDTPGLPLTITAADCTVLSMVDPVKKAIGLVHIGWRGVLKRIAPETLSLIKRNYSSNPRDLLVGISPHIRPCCYVIDARHPDLEETVKTQLKKEGVREENIVTSKLCTSCQRELFFSHRRDGEKSGRMMGVLMLKPPP